MHNNSIIGSDLILFEITIEDIDEIIFILGVVLKFNRRNKDWIEKKNEDLTYLIKISVCKETRWSLPVALIGLHSCQSSGRCLLTLIKQQ